MLSSTIEEGLYRLLIAKRRTHLLATIGPLTQVLLGQCLLHRNITLWPLRAYFEWHCTSKEAILMTRSLTAESHKYCTHVANQILETRDPPEKKQGPKTGFQNCIGSILVRGIFT
jgi:hypothetical protein